MKGQWYGRIEGENKGRIILNIDDIGKYYSGVAFIFPDDQKLPISASFFQTKDKNEKFDFTAYIRPIKPETGLICEWQEIMNNYPGVTLSSQAAVSGYFKENEKEKENTLHLKAKTDIGTEYECNIVNKPVSTITDLKGDIKTWEEYKEYVSDLSENKIIFRGQRKPWKLRTAFHRRGRYVLSTFLMEDVPLLHQHLSARTSHVFHLEVPGENGAFLSLVQHHGYPTPLLDWTYSPYVAAFFAFRDIPKNEKTDDFVRILIFDQKKWNSSWDEPAIRLINTAWPYFSIFDLLAIENERLLPQQSVTTVTNLDDIELYIQTKETQQNCKYLTAIDIPTSERNKVMKELSFMGITAGSMFPGLDGACEALREKMFEE